MALFKPSNKCLSSKFRILLNEKENNFLIFLIRVFLEIDWFNDLDQIGPFIIIMSLFLYQKRKLFFME